MMRFACLLCLTATLATATVAAADQETDLQKFQGRWEVVELVEDGQVVPKQAIEEWLPSGGKFEIAENAIIFVSPHDGKKHVKLFSLDVTQYPKGIDVSTPDQKHGTGIYQFDGGRLIICFSAPDETKRPTEFAAKAGSKHSLMTLQRPAAKPVPVKSEPVKKDPPGTTAKTLTDAEVTKMLQGSWRYTDNIGALFLSFHADKTFSTVREVKELRLFQKVFVQSPVSTGTWNVKNGKLTFHILTSVHPERVNTEFDFSVRSITPQDFIFVDYLGRVGQAVRVQ